MVYDLWFIRNIEQMPIINPSIEYPFNFSLKNITL